MRMCWDKTPENRPTFADIVKKLRALSVLHPIYSSNEYDIFKIQFNFFIVTLICL